MAAIPVLARCPLAGPFATATAVQSVAAGEWAASIDADWEIAGNANGGYLLAMATRALAAAAGRPDPVTVTAHYLSAGQELVQAPGYRPCAIGTVGDYGAGEGRSRIVHAPE